VLLLGVGILVVYVRGTTTMSLVNESKEADKISGRGVRT
jgi:hypothetical protein